MSISDLLWVEKYRPKTLDEIIDREEIVTRLKAFVKTGNVPNMLFVGPPGTGKTTAALALVNDLYQGSTAGKFMELNASDERGINTIREVVKDFARSRPSTEIPFKILILDESDNMTQDAQQALRRIMERYASVTRFILLANYQWGIIEPIQSRCAVFRFPPLSPTYIREGVIRVLEREGISWTEEAIDEIVKAARGDMRKAINIAQSAVGGLKKITEESVRQVVGILHPKEVEEMIMEALKGNFNSARKKLSKLLYDNGLSANDILREMNSELMSIEMDDKKRFQVVNILGEANFRVAMGADAEIQISTVLAALAADVQK
ncbi:MAG: replication factor C small subunit [Crenarchaeota archaeon]|nr:replication factor C small subunit [Thermoproteota archaeon]MDW8033525.1 replication factor C small subunit [Nitrososphaerota archaeon]